MDEGGVAARVRADVIDSVGGMDETAALAALEAACAAWGVGSNDTPLQRLERSLRNLCGNQPMETVTTQQVADWCFRAETSGVALFQRLRTLGAFTRSEEGARRLALMEAVLHQIYLAKNAAISVMQACTVQSRPVDADTDELPAAVDEEGEDEYAAQLDSRIAAWGLKFRWRATVGGDELTPVQELILYMLDVASRQGFRRHGTDIYAPVFVGQHNTRAYRRMYSVKDFVYDCRFTGKDHNYDIFLKLTGGAQNAKALITFLENTNDAQLPVLVKRRFVFSFVDGIYFADTNQFLPYEQCASVPANVVSAKFFDQRFDIVGLPADWRAIPTPELDSILEYQGWPREVIEWFYVLLGRMIFALRHSLDRWQVLVFLYGAAGSGKSLIIQSIIQHLYDACDVGTISNTFEKVFGLSAIADKMLWVAPEVRADFSMDQAVFQSMISGESVSVGVKHQTARSVEWEAPGIMAGNVVPGFTDSQGSMQR